MIYILTQIIGHNQFISLALLTFEVTWFLREGTSLLSDIHNKFAPSSELDSVGFLKTAIFLNSRETSSGIRNVQYFDKKSG